MPEIGDQLRETRLRSRIDIAEVEAVCISATSRMASPSSGSSSGSKPSSPAPSSGSASSLSSSSSSRNSGSPWRRQRSVSSAICASST